MKKTVLSILGFAALGCVHTTFCVNEVATIQNMAINTSGQGKLQKQESSSDNLLVRIFKEMRDFNKTSSYIREKYPSRRRRL